MWKVVCKLQGTEQCTVSDDRGWLSGSYSQNPRKALRGYKYHAPGAGCLVSNNYTEKIPRSSPLSLGFEKKRKKKG